LPAHVIFEDNNTWKDKVMLQNFPDEYQVALDWEWSDWQPHYEGLFNTTLTVYNIDTWLKAWSKVANMLTEVMSRLRVATTVDTNDTAAEAKFQNFMKNINPEIQKQTFALNKKLVNCGLAPNSIKIPLRNIEASIRLFREENLPLIAQLTELDSRYSKLAGAQTVEWEGKEITLRQLMPVFQEQDRAKREKAWLLSQERLRQDREGFNVIWREYMGIRKQMYENADFTNFRDYAWLDRGRFDYTPQDSEEFCDAIAEVVVPATQRRLEIQRQQLGYETLRPWDTQVDPLGRDALKPYATIDELIDRTEAIFQQVDPDLGNYFSTMKNENLLDLDNRKGKRPGGYCTYFPVSERPFIFMNAVGLDGDVRTLLHEAGHAFHGMSNQTSYQMQRRAPMEFNEVASMAMELLAVPYITHAKGGYFNEDDARRYCIDHLDKIINFWAYMAVVVAFQDWIYTHHDDATNPDNCDAKWLELWKLYQGGVDWTGYEDFIVNRWRQQLHIFLYPFYYVEYGLAQLGAVQVWANALQNQADALAQYRAALKLGGTVTLPELFQTAGAKLSFDAATLKAAVDLIEQNMTAMGD
jgi:oligoendopeptidase F